MPFRIDSLKREYKNNSEEDTKKWFSENYDPEKCSVWFARYKEELPSMGFVRMNRINGFYQQFDNKLRNKSFAMGVFKYAENELCYVWFFSSKEGPDVPEEMTSTSFYDSCEWTQLDRDDPRIWETLYPQGDRETFLYI